MIRIIFMIISTAIFATNVWAKACNNTTFRNFYDIVKHQNAGNPSYIRFDKTPDNYNPFYEHCYGNDTTGGCFETYGSRYKLVATSGLTTKWSAAVCGKARQANYWPDFEHRIFLQGQNAFYAGPKVSFQYQGNDGRWRILRGTNTGNLASWEIAANATQRYRWKWFSNEPRRFRIVVERAMNYDEFDLIMDW